MSTQIKEMFPLSPQQRRVWELQRAGGVAPFRAQCAILVEGALDAETLKAALLSVVARHEILRTTFHEAGEAGAPGQAVADCGVYWDEFHDISRWDATLQEIGLANFFRGAEELVLHVEHGPLVRASVVKLAEARHVLHLTLPALCADAPTLKKLTRAIGRAYAARVEGGEPEAETLQYADVSQWLNELLESEEMRAGREHWRRQEVGRPGGFRLAFEQPVPSPEGFEPKRAEVKIEGGLLSQLKGAADALGARPELLLHAAWQVLLWNHGQHPDEIVVGTAHDGLNYEELADTLGPLTKYLPIRCRLDADLTFGELVRRTAAQTREAHDRQQFFCAEEAARDGADGPGPFFFPFCFDFDDEGEPFEAGGLTLSIFNKQVCADRFKLKLTCTQRREALLAELHYDAGLFSAADAESLASQLRALLASVAGGVEAPLSRLRLLDEEEERRLVAGRGRAAPLGRGECLHELFEAQAARTPDRVAVVYEGTTLTYRELNGRANRLAHSLRAKGCGPERLVALCVERTAELAVAILGILKSGAAYLPLDPEYPPQRLSYMLEDSAVGVLLTQDSLAGRFSGTAAEVLRLDADWQSIAQYSDENPRHETGPSNLAYVIYTSGSTGRSKGVMVTHANVASLFDATRAAFDFDEEDAWTLFHSYAFDFSVWEFWGALLFGGRVVVVPYLVSRSPAAFIELLRRERITVLNQTPSAFRQLVRAEQEAGATASRLRLVIFGGEALELSSLRPWFDSHGDESPRLVNMYGITETTVHVTRRALSSEDAEGRRGSLIGGPIESLELYVLDRHGRPAPVGVAGELYIGGDGLARGYLNRPALTAERFTPDPFSPEPGARLYRTGDVARRLPGGEVEYLGRADRQVKLRGFRIELGEVEAVLAEHPSVSECVVIDRQAAAGDKRLVACVVAGGGLKLTAGALREHARQHLPDYMLPTEWVWLEKLPLTGNGKLDHRALGALAEAGRARETGREYVAPRTVTEELLCGVWQDVLGAERVGVFDNFFEVGGQSLLATQMISRVRQRFGVELPLRSVFESPTVAGLAEHVELATRAGRGVQLPPIEPAPRDGDLPLSFAQARLWFLNQLEPESLLHNCPIIVPLGGGLNVAALEKTFNEILRRHEALRTTFKAVGGRPVQVIEPHQTARLEVVDLTGVDEGERAATFRRAAREEIVGIFDLQRGPLLRVKLFKLEDEQHVLILTTHHIVSDGWSVGVLADEVAALYSAFSEGRPSPLPELKVQYADFARWQRQWLSGETLEQLLGYWRNQLGPQPATLELQTDRPRASVQDYNAARHALALPAHLTEPLRALSRKEGVTLFMLLLAAFKTVLHRYTGQDEIVVGTDIANRGRAEIEGLIGYFVNQLVLRTDLSGRPTFRELLGRVREVCLGAYMHQDMPFEYLVEAMQPERDLSRAPLFQVKFALQNTPNAKTEWGGPRAKDKDGRGQPPKEVETQSQHDLTLSLTETGDTISGWLEYRVSLFDAATVARLAGHLTRCLEALVAEPSTRISDAPLLSEAESRLLLQECNDTRGDYPRGSCLHQLVETQAAATPERIALSFGGEQLSYAELNGRADRLARRLRRQGVGPEVSVAVCLERSTEMVVALLAVLKAGGAYIPLDPSYPRERVNFILEDSGARVLLTRGHLAESLPREGVVVVRTDADPEETARQDDGNVGAGVAPDNLAYVIYTSGSTGRPKGVQISHRAAVNFLSSMAREPGVCRDDVLLAVTTLSFDIALLEIFLPLTAGARVAVASREDAQDPQALAAELRRTGASVMQATPSTWRMLVESGWPPAPALRMLCGGEQLGRELARQLAAQDCTLWNLYGPTESTVWSSLSRVEPGDGAITLGRPIANTELYVLDAGLHPVPLGVAGELYIGGDGLARGYLNRPALTAERFTPDPFSEEPGARLYRTGDVARRLPGGEVEYLGRADRQVKLRGFRIELGEVEAVLAEHASVGAAVAAVREDARGEKHLVAYFVAREGQPPGDGELRAHLKARLPEYMIPSFFMPLEALPLTPNGKVDRQALPAPAPAPRDAAQAFVAPRNQLEHMLADIWSEVLSAGRVGVNDNFFELGGHSLLATQIISRVGESFGVKIPLRSLFEEPTVAGLAEIIKTAMSVGAEAKAPPLRPVARGGPFPVTFNQERRIERARLTSSMPAPLNQCFILSGPLDTRALGLSLNEICARHEALRTVFRTDGVEPVQLILPPRAFALPVRDLGGLPAAERRAAALCAAEEEIKRPFDLAEGPLFRATLLRLGEEEHLLVLCIEHIVGDGWSLQVLNRELATLYTSFAAGLPSPLPPLRVQYADFAHWQRNWLRGEVLETFLSYWRQQLGGTIPEMEFPLDHPRRTRAESGGTERQQRELPLALAQSLKALGQREGATLFMTTLAAFNTLVLHYTDKEDISILSPIAGRTHVETERLIGWFNNILVLRTDLSGDPTFLELLARTRKVTLDAYAHQDVPYALLVKDMQPERDLSPTTPAQVYFDLMAAGEEQGARGDARRGPGGGRLRFDRTVINERSPGLDISFGVTEFAHGMTASALYMTDLFEPSTISRLLENYHSLLARVVAEPHARLSELRVF